LFEIGSGITFGGGMVPLLINLPMSKREYQHVEHDLERALSRLRDTKDPNLRRELLQQMRCLLAEADRFVANVPKWRSD
jgi:hypothetical protein